MFPSIATCGCTSSNPTSFLSSRLAKIYRYLMSSPRARIPQVTRMSKRNTCSPMILIFFLLSKNSLSVTIRQICNIGLVLSCGIFAARMMIEVAFGSVRTISVENGRRSRVNLQNVAAVAARNIAARIAKRMRGFFTVTGAKLRSSNNSLAIQPNSSYYTSLSRAYRMHLAALNVRGRFGAWIVFGVLGSSFRLILRDAILELYDTIFGFEPTSCLLKVITNSAQT